MTSINKGNVVELGTDSHALVLAITKDGKRAKLHAFGFDTPIWRNIASFTVIEQGAVTCWKCGGSGLYYFGGEVLNGVYQGKTGPCYGCEGKGKQDDSDRLRCFWYWHGGREDAMPESYEVAA